jgi:hypothetical protein
MSVCKYIFYMWCGYYYTKSIEKYTEANNEHKEEKSEGQGMFILGSKGYKGAVKDKTH